jgi:hypothetical protein
VSLYPLGISRRRDIPSVPKQAAGSLDMRWSLAGELACAFIDAPHQPVPPMLHATALDAIHRRICVLPVRFGLALHDEAEICSMLDNRSGELLEHLDRLDRTCEIGLRIAPTAPPETHVPARPKPRSPLAYIEARRSHYRRTDDSAERDRLIVEQVVERLCGFYRQWRKLISSPSCPIRLAFLIEKGREAAFRSRVESTCRAERDRRCVILGPWPPYSFV